MPYSHCLLFMKKSITSIHCSLSLNLTANLLIKAEGKMVDNFKESTTSPTGKNQEKRTIKKSNLNYQNDILRDLVK